MRRVSDTETFTTGAAKTLGPGRFANDALLSVILVLAAGGSGNVLLKLTRGTVVSTLATVPMTGITSALVEFPGPVVLTDADILTIDGTGCGQNGSAMINYERE